jgi:hypothetical protein
MINAHNTSIVTPQIKASPETLTAATGDTPFLFPLDVGSDETAIVGFAGFWTMIGFTLKEASLHALVNSRSLASAKRLRLNNAINGTNG